MAGERYVVLGLGTARAAWFTDVARWATVGSVPVEFVKCISGEELRARLGSGRPFSAVLVDALAGAIDRDLLDLAASRSVPVIVVDDGRGTRDWPSLGVRAVLPATFDRQGLLDTLAHASSMIGAAAVLPLPESEPAAAASGDHLLVACTGSGGTGTSTVAVALAQGFATDANDGSVVLADLRLDAELAMLHDARDIVPGLHELVDAHRSARPTPQDVRSLTFDATGRGYRLLLGLRRHRDWTALRPRSFEAALDGLQSAFAITVADIDPDVEGEPETGSVEVEERNLMARAVTRRADVVVVVGRSGVKGVHSLVRVANDLRTSGVEPSRLLVAVTAAPRSPRTRAELTRTIADLTGATAGLEPVAGPLFLPERRGLDEVHRDGARLPAALTKPLVAAVRSVVAHRDEAVATAARLEPVRVVPGTLGRWAEQEAAGR